MECKGGSPFNGILTKVDNLMNICLGQVVETSVAGTRFWSMKEIWIRGSTVRSEATITIMLIFDRSKRYS